jgi:hypothetical protein
MTLALTLASAGFLVLALVWVYLWRLAPKAQKVQENAGSSRANFGE